ncbi:MAG: Npt1/Npt2 family nucleotide transporter [Parachlamydiales bacterium]|jgi:AAA family ATP:ADP antiporter
MSQFIKSSPVTSFGKWRGYFFPIHRHEFIKFLPMMAMLMLIVFNYTILRNMKDSVIVTAAGAEVIPFIKVWVMLPCAVLITLIFAKLTNRFSQEKVYYLMISGFLICYGLFAFVLYPMRDALHPHESALALMDWLPEGFKGLVNMYRYWTFTLFYVVSELWSSMIMTTLFWGLANEVYSVIEARRFYGVLTIAGNFAGIIASEVTVLVTSWTTSNSQGFAQDWESVMQYLIVAVIGAGIVSMGIFYWMNRTVLAAPVYEELHSSIETIEHKKKKKKRLSMRESISYLSKSKYIICIAIIVVSYNLVINLVEVVWKDKVSQLYPESVDYNTYMAHITIATNIISSTAAFFISQILMACGWTRTALVTPIIMLVTCTGFFGFLFVQDNMVTPFAFLGATPLAIAVFFGGAQNCLSRAAKFSVFDATKEMSFIPLDHESKLKGKAAIDGVGSRLGKSGGSLIHQGLLMIFSTLSAITPFVGVILMIVIIGWIAAVRMLGVQFNVIVDKQEREANRKEPESVASTLQECVPANA